MPYFIFIFFIHYFYKKTYQYRPIMKAASNGKIYTSQKKILASP